MMATPARYDAPEAAAQAATDPDAEGFDLAAWVAGVAPVTHAVTLYARGDLLGDLDVLHARITNAKGANQTKVVRELTKQAQEIAAQIEASALDVVVQGWAQDRVSAFQEDLKARGVEGEDLSIEQAAAQVVSPEGFTADMYRRLLDVIRPQAMQIAAAAVAANRRVPVVTVPS